MNNSTNLSDLRHSCAHLLAAAVLKLYPNTKLTIGPSIDDGFYYDFDFEKSITEENLTKIEKQMAEILPVWTGFSHREVNAKKAKEIFKDNQYKLELIDEIESKGEKITLYKCGDFEDLCRGGHSRNPSKEIGAFKLISLAGAYWRGSEKNKMLTRIYGTCFTTKEELNKHLEIIEEAKKRDHKKLGLELELFMFHETSPGMPYWLPKGFVLYSRLLEFSRSIHKKFGYQEIATPVLNKKQLYETSGHWFHYRDDMFLSPMSFLREETKDPLEGSETFGIKPMNCPNVMNVFSLTTRSYKDLPLRFSETSALHRFEPSGTLNGLFRAREFHQDDAHIFIRHDQVENEFEKVMEMIEVLYGAFKLNYRLRFGTRPEKFMGEAKDWDEAESALKAVLDKSKNDYVVEEEEGAFYGPKVDILMKDSLGREWQTGTIQLDFQQPKNFNLSYIDQNGQKVTPAVMHRAIYGSFERFIGILTEHYTGAFPIWLSPVQAAILPITDKHNDYGEKIVDELEKMGIRATLDDRSERLQLKIRDATLQKIPYLGIIGDEEIEKQTISVRARDGKDMGKMNFSEFLQKVKKEIEEKV